MYRPRQRDAQDDEGEARGEEDAAGGGHWLSKFVWHCGRCNSHHRLLWCEDSRKYHIVGFRAVRRKHQTVVTWHLELELVFANLVIQGGVNLTVRSGVYDGK